MTTRFKEYTVDIIDESAITLDSTDNLFTYNKIYFAHTEHNPTSKHGIRVSRGEQCVSSILICGTGGATAIHNNSSIIEDDVLLVCCCETIYSFKLPALTLNWRKKFDPATCFAIYSFKGDFVIHGELEIKRIDLDGNVKWNFSGKDIFVKRDGSDAIKLTGDRIELTDWEGNKYILDDNGQLTN